MTATNLIAYIPALTQRYLDWFIKHPGADLVLISQEMAGSLRRELSRNLGGLPTEVQARLIQSLPAPWDVLNTVQIFNPSGWTSSMASYGDWILPNEDISHSVAERYLAPLGIRPVFESVWARWDMTAVKRQTPIPEGIPVTDRHQNRMAVARAVAERSPDGWRQVGAALYISGHCAAAAAACNDHYPTPYEQDLRGDIRSLYEAGQPGKYHSLHAERGVIAECACRGVPTKGGYLYVTVFPCEDCAREIVVAGISHVFFEEWYSSPNALEIFQAHGVELVQVQKGPA